jgi:hypothetical protein
MLGDEYLILFLTAAAQKQLVVPVEVSMGARKNILQLCNRKISASWTENAAEKMTSKLPPKYTHGKFQREDT